MTKPIDRAEMKAQTRKLLQTAQVSPKGMTALYCACLFLLSLLEALIPGPELVSTFLSILTTLAEWILAAGFALYCMDIRRRERSEYAVLFDGFSFTGKIIALNIVINLFVFLWSMLFVFPGIIAYYRYSFALYNLYEDPEMDIMEALNLSKRQTQGYKSWISATWAGSCWVCFPVSFSRVRRFCLVESVVWIPPQSSPYPCLCGRS